MYKNLRYTEESDHVDRAIARIAGRQHGNITTQQLLSMGLSTAGIAHRVAIGRLHRVFHGVYSVGTFPTQPIARAAAAMLACGKGAALSHGSALTLWGMWKRWEEPFEFTSRRHIRRDCFRVHRAKLDRRDVVKHRGFLVTARARTLLDIAPRLREKSLRRLVNDARRAELVTVGELRAVVARYPRHPGVRALRPFVTNPTGPTRSELEDRFQEFCRHFDLPQPLVNTHLLGFEVDALFPEEGLIVELDGWPFHNNKHAFERDREQDATTLAAGFATVRMTWERIEGKSEREAERLKTILARRRA